MFPWQRLLGATSEFLSKYGISLFGWCVMQVQVQYNSYVALRVYQYVYSYTSVLSVVND